MASFFEIAVDGETEPPFAEGLSIDIGSTGEITWSDGCNDHTAKLKLSDSGGFSIDRSEVQMTLLLCFEVDPDTGEEKPFSSPDDARFEGLLWSVRAYELREGRLWLYYGGSKKNALVFR